MIHQMTVACALVACVALAAPAGAQERRAKKNQGVTQTTKRSRPDKVEAHVKKILALAMELREAGFEEEAQALIRQGKRLADKSRKRLKTKSKKEKKSKSKRRTGRDVITIETLPREVHAIKYVRSTAIAVTEKALGVAARQQMAAAERLRRAADVARSQKQVAVAESYERAADSLRRTAEALKRSYAAVRQPRPTYAPRAPRPVAGRRDPRRAKLRVDPERARIQDRVTSAIERAKRGRVARKAHEAVDVYRRTADEYAKARAEYSVKVATKKRADDARRKATTLRKKRADERVAKRAKVRVERRVEVERFGPPGKAPKARRGSDLDGRVDRLADEVEELKAMIRDLKRSLSSDRGSRRRRRGTR